MSDIDHHCTEEVVCPHCGYEHDESHEFFSDFNDHTECDCSSCGKSFTAYREFSVSYWTEKPKPEPEQVPEWVDWVPTKEGEEFPDGCQYAAVGCDEWNATRVGHRITYQDIRETVANETVWRIPNPARARKEVQP